MIGLVFQATKSMALAMTVPLLCYICVGLYAFWGSKLLPRAAT
jgi:fucose permease